MLTGFFPVRSSLTRGNVFGTSAFLNMVRLAPNATVSWLDRWNREPEAVVEGCRRLHNVGTRTFFLVHESHIVLLAPAASPAKEIAAAASSTSAAAPAANAGAAAAVAAAGAAAGSGVASASAPSSAERTAWPRVSQECLDALLGRGQSGLEARVAMHRAMGLGDQLEIVSGGGVPSSVAGRARAAAGRALLELFVAQSRFFVHYCDVGRSSPGESDHLAAIGQAVQLLCLAWHSIHRMLLADGRRDASAEELVARLLKRMRFTLYTGSCADGNSLDPEANLALRLVRAPRGEGEGRRVFHFTGPERPMRSLSVAVRGYEMPFHESFRPRACAEPELRLCKCDFLETVRFISLRQLPPPISSLLRSLSRVVLAGCHRGSSPPGRHHRHRVRGPDVGAAARAGPRLERCGGSPPEHS